MLGMRFFPIIAVFLLRGRLMGLQDYGEYQMALS